MNRRMLGVAFALATVVGLSSATECHAQVVVVGSPYVQPVVSYRPVVSVSSYRVAPVYSTPVYSAPVVQRTAYYAPPVRVQRVPVPVAVPAPIPVPVPVNPVWVRPKVYVGGQPIRNTLRAITP